jgi:hypothetical protein
MEVRRLCKDNEFYYEVSGIKTKTPFFKNVRPHGNSLAICLGSVNSIDWREYIIGRAFLFIKNPFSILSDNRIVTQSDRGEWSVLDYYGKTIVPYGMYSKIDGFKSRLARVKKTNAAIFWDENREEYFDTFGIIDIEGKEIVDCSYDEIYHFYNTDNWFTVLKKQGKAIKYHLGYRKEFNIDDVEWMQYMEDRGSLIRWDKDYGYDNFKYVSNRATYIHDNDEDDQEDDLV